MGKEVKWKLTISEKQISADKVYKIIHDFAKEHGLDVDTENGSRFEVQGDFIEVDYTPIFDEGKLDMVNLNLYKEDKKLTTKLATEEDLRNALYTFGIDPDYHKDTIELAM